jgi:hypothetical protein
MEPFSEKYSLLEGFEIDTQVYDGVSKSFRTGRLAWELQMVQLSATMCRYIAILWVSLVSSIAITLCVASQWVIIVIIVYFVIDSARKRLDTPSYYAKVKSQLNELKAYIGHGDKAPCIIEFGTVWVCPVAVISTE